MDAGWIPNPSSRLSGNSGILYSLDGLGDSSGMGSSSDFDDSGSSGGSDGLGSSGSSGGLGGFLEGKSDLISI